MREKVLKAASASVTVALGVTFVSVIGGEGFSLLKTMLCMVVAFIIDFIFSLIFYAKKK